jgi:hypothetical protein
MEPKALVRFSLDCDPGFFVERGFVPVRSRPMTGIISEYGRTRGFRQSVCYDAPSESHEYDSYTGPPTTCKPPMYRALATRACVPRSRP